METRAIKIRSDKNPEISISIIPGHFVTAHSHVNFYIDMTATKHRHDMAAQAAKYLSKRYREGNVAVDTVICMDGCEVIGAFLAAGVARDGHTPVHVITPEYNPNGQLLFRDNVQRMVWGKNVVLLVASATTGKTIRRALECIRYYGGTVVGTSAIFSAIGEAGGVPVDSVFTRDDLPDYRTYSHQDCPLCKEGRKIDAIVNSYGYSKM
ncbi:MAG TPA: orotate phosphoribosyltransferase [Ruminococcaceae bacterium]|jgi:orotate phosphoribosyltransferase|nr:orotate phosphoribosyltransferase [Oscillospiraceae bacterium]HBQ47021.1 orotate phosphoribosyltransferase [Oscillospiraceae bacterium]HBT91354.1 orotate phosphoribosyltransferase [Oscillospiraceae bacterium]HCB91252.1 orotate phosphoribosyltransferase [Oscillospiraceae bacterium]